MCCSREPIKRNIRNGCGCIGNKAETRRHHDRRIASKDVQLCGLSLEKRLSAVACAPVGRTVHTFTLYSCVCVWVKRNGTEFYNTFYFKRIYMNIHPYVAYSVCSVKEALFFFRSSYSYS